MKTRDEILGKALDECVTEMYRWAQPSIDLQQLIKDGYKDGEENPLYSKHYLSSDNYAYIKDSYASAYGIVDDWNDIFDLIYRQLNEGGIEDDYKPATKERPGYRDYKRVDSLKEHLKNPEDYDTVIEYIKKIQNFFKGHCRELNQFSMSLALGMSPTSNPKDVETYWQEHGRPDFKVKEFNIGDVIYGGVNDEYIDITEDEFINTLK